MLLGACIMKIQTDFYAVQFQKKTANIGLYET